MPRVRVVPARGVARDIDLDAIRAEAAAGTPRLWLRMVNL